MEVLAAVPEAVAIDFAIADKPFGGDAIHWQLLEHDIAPVIPSKVNRTEPIDHDPGLYRKRNHIERLVGKLKQFRRIATRHDTRAVNRSLLHDSLIRKSGLIAVRIRRQEIGVVEMGPTWRKRQVSSTNRSACSGPMLQRGSGRPRIQTAAVCSAQQITFWARRQSLPTLDALQNTRRTKGRQARGWAEDGPFGPRFAPPLRLGILSRSSSAPLRADVSTCAGRDAGWTKP
jgi:hypothetical protein